MSTKEQMEYLLKPQTLRNKDYVTITRNEYDRMVEAHKDQETLRRMVIKLTEKEIELNRREKDLKKTEHKIRYECHKKILDFAKQFINGC
jgi:23S rRNA maturation mini-RNase III